MQSLCVVAPEAFASIILVMGAPRSGTTWLAKIIDSHPDVLYRHEPDETSPACRQLTPASLPVLLQRWVTDRSARTVTKRPFFRKSWQPAGARALHSLLAGAVSAASHLPSPLHHLARAQIPDLMHRPPSRVVIKSVRWGEGAAVFGRTFPNSRTIFILRHPCGQVASVMRGHRQQRFDLRTSGTDMPFDEAAAQRFAGAHGIDEAEFQALPDAAKYAWSWRAFNEPAYAVLAGQPNVYVLLYEGLCDRPEELARQILAFVGLDWTEQSARFVAHSTMSERPVGYQWPAGYRRPMGYYTVFRNAVAAAESWRKAMPLIDQHAVRSVVSASTLASFWPDLMPHTQT